MLCGSPACGADEVPTVHDGALTVECGTQCVRCPFTDSTLAWVPVPSSHNDSSQCQSCILRLLQAPHALCGSGTLAWPTGMSGCKMISRTSCMLSTPLNICVATTQERSREHKRYLKHRTPGLPSGHGSPKGTVFQGARQ